MSLQELSDRMRSIEAALELLSVVVERHTGQIGGVMQDRTRTINRIDELEGKVDDHEALGSH